MALSDEQNAMLRLLASGGQGYDDIAALMGLSVDEVRAKVVGALAQLEAEGKPTPNVPPPLAGGAQPAAEVAPTEPEPVEEAPEPAAPAAAIPPASPPPSGSRTITLPTGRNAWILGGGILAAIVVIVVIVLVASGGSDSPSTTAPNTATTAGEESEAEEGKAEEASSGTSKEATQAELTAVDGSEAAGLATFGRVKKKLALAIEASGLEPTTEGTDSYTIWLAQSAKRMLPLASTAVKSSGKGANQIAAEFEVPVEILAYLAKGTFDEITITRTDNSELAASLKTATKEKSTPTYTGEPILSGTIHGPIVGLPGREEEEKKEEGE